MPSIEIQIERTGPTWFAKITAVGYRGQEYSAVATVDEVFALMGEHVRACAARKRP